jgi:hypothetical protein
MGIRSCVLLHCVGVVYHWNFEWLRLWRARGGCSCSMMERRMCILNDGEGDVDV